MSDALNIAVNGLNASTARVANAASSIVNASSTGSDGDITAGLVAIAKEKTVYAAEAKVVKIVAENNKALLDILA
jgi:hypothetical protein